MPLPRLFCSSREFATESGLLLLRGLSPSNAERRGPRTEVVVPCGDITLAARLRLSATALEQALEELLFRDLIAYQPPLTQVLSLPAVDQRRSTPLGPTPPIQTSPGQTPPGHGLFLMRDILREAAGLPTSDNPHQESP